MEIKEPHLGHNLENSSKNTTVSLKQAAFQVMLHYEIIHSVF